MSAAGRRVRTDALAVGATTLNILIVVMRNPHEDADVGAFFEVENLPGIFDSLPRGL